MAKKCVALLNVIIVSICLHEKKTEIILKRVQMIKGHMHPFVMFSTFQDEMQYIFSQKTEKLYLPKPCVRARCRCEIYVDDQTIL